MSENTENTKPTRNPIDYFCRRVTATHPTKLAQISFLTCLSQFDLFSDRLVINFPDWSEESFANYGETLDWFTKSYQLSGAEFEAYKTENQEFIEAIKTRTNEYCNADTDAQFRYFRLSVKDEFIKASCFKENETIQKTFAGQKFKDLINEDKQLGENSLVAKAVQLAFQIAFAKESNYWQATENY